MPAPQPVNHAAEPNQPTTGNDQLCTFGTLAHCSVNGGWGWECLSFVPPRQTTSNDQRSAHPHLPSRPAQRTARAVPIRPRGSAAAARQSPARSSDRRGGVDRCGGVRGASSVKIRDVGAKGVEVGKRQNRCGGADSVEVRSVCGQCGQCVDSVQQFNDAAGLVLSRHCWGLPTLHFPPHRLLPHPYTWWGHPPLWPGLQPRVLGRILLYFHDTTNYAHGLPPQHTSRLPHLAQDLNAHAHAHAHAHPANCTAYITFTFHVSNSRFSMFRPKRASFGPEYVFNRSALS